MTSTALAPSDERLNAINVLRAAFGVLLDEDMPTVVQNPDILAGFNLLAKKITNAIDEDRESELALLRHLATFLLEEGCIPKVILGEWIEHYSDRSS